MRWLVGIGAVGSTMTALCCAGILTPLLVALLVAVGLGSLTRSLDLILLPALVVFLLLAVIGWRGRRKVTTPSPRGVD